MWLIKNLLWHVLPESWYRKIPDDCEMPGCRRLGVWGNENVITIEHDKRLTLCDGCTSRYLTERAEVIASRKGSDVRLSVSLE